MLCMQLVASVELEVDEGETTKLASEAPSDAIFGVLLNTTPSSRAA
jgi:hypothetical protein